ncbi:MAG: HPF/RaiA family ribosome-associated protein [Candidatus Omnitrophota bacterium]|nr:MAG: HPF/RaiA family ribosome-associated protein [Candidatus Omnitrophota bacterium]
MRVDVSFKYLERSDFIDNVLDKNIKKIERRIKMFRRDDPVHVSVHMEKNPNREQYFCRTQVYLPSRVVMANGKGVNSSQVINKSFSALSKQLEKVKHRMERHLRKK